MIYVPATIKTMAIRQLLIDLGDLFFYKKLEQELSDLDSVLDLGCGSNSPLSRIRKTFYSVGVDIFEPSIEESKKAKIHHEYKVGNVLDIDKYFVKKSFDVVVALDLIEHLEKEDGLLLINKMEMIAKKKIVILTPNGFTHQDAYGNNPYQVHRSSWEKQEFKQHGFTVRGMRGLRWLRGECATLKFKPWFFWGLISTISQFFVYFIPELAYQLFAVKRL